MRAFVKYARATLCVLLCLCMALTAVVAAGDSASFLAAVDEISDAVTYEERSDAVAYARSLYDASMAEEEGVAEALATLERYAAELLSVKTAADAYIAAVARAEEAHGEENYADTVAALSEADSKYEAATAVPGYPGLSAAEYTRSRIREELFEPEQASLAYIAAAKAIESCTTYEDARAQWIEMRDLTEEILPDYPGIAEAEEIYRRTEAYLSECERVANDFIAGVQDATGAEGYAAELCRLLRLRDSVDFTVEGVRTANTTLNYLVKEYNNAVRAANEEAGNASSIGLTVGMTPR
ncbi:MAG TPA: hypothetical protein DDY70_02180 [Clostridiales bacterium]|nr:hypothetical protein [Clostridiales bacterium]